MSKATFSPCGLYRYDLHRKWTFGKGRCAFIMLNPSTADDTSNDPTVTRCINYAMGWGMNELVVLNLFALRSTDPAALYKSADPVGPENDLFIRHRAKAADLVVCAWGNHGSLNKRSDTVVRLLRELEIFPKCLKVTNLGHPSHPLYLKKSISPVDYSLPVGV